MAAAAREIARRVAQLEAVSGLKVSFVPSDEDRDAGYPFYRPALGGGFRYMARERGQVVMEELVADVDELARRVLRDLAAQLAQAYEVRHRIPGQDSRRQWFALAETWLSALEPAWGAAEQERHAQILRSAPFRDQR